MQLFRGQGRQLPNDVARCVGVNERICDTCARLSIDGSARVWLWPDPVPKDGRCEHHIQMQTRDGAQA